VKAGRARLILPLLAAAVLAAVASGCSVTGSSSASTNEVTPAVVDRYVQVQMAEANLTRVINVLAGADLSDQALAKKQPGPGLRQAALGSQFSWDAVAVALNAFTPAQANVTPEVATMAGRMKLLSTHWENALNTIYQHPPPTRKGLLQSLKGPLREEFTQKHLLQDTALALSKQACTLGSTYRQLATPKEVVSACGAVKALASPPSS
jgi:hypothetical protein